MAVGWLVSVAMGWTGANRTGGGSYEAFLIAMVLSIIVALYCLTLPDTPPLARERASGGWAGLDEMLALIRKPDVRVFLVPAFGVYLTTPMVYQVMPGFPGRGCRQPRPWDNGPKSPRWLFYRGCWAGSARKEHSPWASSPGWHGSSACWVDHRWPSPLAVDYCTEWEWAASLWEDRFFWTAGLQPARGPAPRGYFWC